LCEQDSGWEPTQQSARLGKRQASIPAEDIDVLRGASLDLGAASRSGSAMFGAHRYSAEDSAGASAADEADSSFSTRYGDGSSGGGAAHLDAQLDGSPTVPGFAASLQLPRSPLDFGSVSAEAGGLQPVSGGRLQERLPAGAEPATDAVPPADPDAPRHSTSKTRRDAALAAYVATQLSSQG
jgi:hypothetical protein